MEGFTPDCCDYFSFPNGHHYVYWPTTKPERSHYSNRCLVNLYAQVVLREIAVELRCMYIHILLIQALGYAVVVWVQMQA